MLLGGQDERAARGLLAAFAWSAADIAQMARPSPVLETMADVLHWQGYGVFLFACARGGAPELERMVVRATAERVARLGPPRVAGEAAKALLSAAAGQPRPPEAPWESGAAAAWIGWPILVAGSYDYLMVLEAESLTPSVLDALGAFVRLVEVTLSRIADHEALASKLDRHEVTKRSAIATERFAVLGEAAAVLAHELRNPLGTISNAVTLLEREGAAEQEVARSIIREEVTRLDTLVKDLLHLARPLDRARRRVELGDLVHTTLDRARRQLNGTHVLVPPLALPEAVEVTGDPALLALVLENLVRNAAQAAPRDSQIRVEIAPRLADVTLSIEDDGPGVTTAMRERIFEPFFTTRAVGTGLGLSIVKRLVEAHGGSVNVGASRTGGARFDLVFARSR